MGHLPETLAPWNRKLVPWMICKVNFSYFVYFTQKCMHICKRLANMMLSVHVDFNFGQSTVWLASYCFSHMCATIQLVHVSSSGYWRFLQNGKTPVSLFEIYSIFEEGENEQIDIHNVKINLNVVHEVAECLLSKWDFNLLHDMYITFSYSVQTLGFLAVPSVSGYT